MRSQGDTLPAQPQIDPSQAPVDSEENLQPRNKGKGKASSFSKKINLSSLPEYEDSIEDDDDDFAYDDYSHGHSYGDITEEHQISLAITRSLRDANNLEVPQAESSSKSDT